MSYGLNGGYAYFMDERDVGWVERNNKEARGEGTSASGSVRSPSVETSPQRRGRSAKGKGKEVEHVNGYGEYPAVVMDEDEFELTMGLFEKFADDKFPGLHVVSVPFPVLLPP